VREHSRFAATVVLIFYAMDTLASFKLLLGSPEMIVLRAIITGLLPSNLRATWIAARWKSGSDEAAKPQRLDDGLSDIFANRWPSRLWPKIRILYYIFSIGVVLVVGVGLAVMATRAPRLG
jgi:hypothetical protein